MLTEWKSKIVTTLHLSENLAGRPRGVAEQQGADRAGRDVGGEWFLAELLNVICSLVSLTLLLKVRGARLLKEMVKPEDETEDEDEDESQLA